MVLEDLILLITGIIAVYKNDIKKDYTYPIGTKSPIIKVSVTTAK